MRGAAVIAIVLGLGVGARADAPKPEPLHRDAIPAGDRWWCYSAPVSGMTGCLRSEDDCAAIVRRFASIASQVEARAGDEGLDLPRAAVRPCNEGHDIWVRTGTDQNSNWTYYAGPSRDACEHSEQWDMIWHGRESACERWHEHDVPPDPAIVPAGTGWWCTDVSIDATTTAICARTKAWCTGIAHAAKGRACKPARAAYVFTSRGRFHAFGAAAACGAARDAEEDVSRCEATP